MAITIGAIAIYLGKIVITKGFDAASSKFEAHLAQLKKEHEIKFSSLHQQMADVIKQLYAEFYDLEKALITLTSPTELMEGEEYEESRKIALDKHGACLSTLEKNRIFFKDELCQKIEENLESCRKVISTVFWASLKAKRMENLAKDGVDFSYVKEGDWPDEIYDKQWEVVTIELRQQREELAEPFREIFGVT